MDVSKFAEKKLKELRRHKLDILDQNKKVPSSLLQEIKYHRKVIELDTRDFINKIKGDY